MAGVELNEFPGKLPPSNALLPPMAESSIPDRCPKCGTPLGFAWKDGTGAADLTVGSFDDPARFRPVAHAGAEGINESWIDTRDLPRHYTADTQSVVERWEAAGLEVPE